MITIAFDNYYGDWMAIYKDGELLAQDHSFSPRDLMILLDLDYEIIEANVSIQEDSQFPRKLEDLVE